MKFALFAAAALAADATGAALGAACDAGLDDKHCSEGNRCATAGGAPAVVAAAAVAWAFTADSTAAVDSPMGSATVDGTVTLSGTACGAATPVLT